MFQVVVFTLLLILGGWYFFFRKERRPKAQDQLSKNQQKKTTKTSKDNSEKIGNHAENQERSKTEAQVQGSSTIKKPKNKVEHSFFFKSFKKNESSITDFDISRDSQYLAIASKDRTHVLYNIKKDSMIKFTTSKLH
jgi:hypothetical protein